MTVGLYGRDAFLYVYWQAIESLMSSSNTSAASTSLRALPVALFSDHAARSARALRRIVAPRTFTQLIHPAVVCHGLPWPSPRRPLGFRIVLADRQ